MTASGSDWHLIVEHDAPPSPYAEDVAEEPGVGDCVRDDGQAGSLAALIPDGWRLIDTAHVVITPGGRHHRIYVACAGDVVVPREHFSPVRRWTATDARLQELGEA